MCGGGEGEGAAGKGRGFAGRAGGGEGGTGNVQLSENTHLTGSKEHKHKLTATAACVGAGKDIGAAIYNNAHRRHRLNAITTDSSFEDEKLVSCPNSLHITISSESSVQHKSGCLVCVCTLDYVYLPLSMLPLPLGDHMSELLVVRLQSEAFMQQSQPSFSTASSSLQGSQTQQGLYVLGISLQG